jgi:hypothetical protein
VPAAGDGAGASGCPAAAAGDAGGATVPAAAGTCGGASDAHPASETPTVIASAASRAVVRDGVVPVMSTPSIRGAR